MSDERTIILKGCLGRRYEEAKMAGAGKPGHLIEIDSAGEYQVHSTRGGRAIKRFLVEDDLQGNTIDDAYADNDVGRSIVAEPGDIINCRLKIGENVAINDWLTSGGDGSVVKAASSYLANIAAASTAVTNTIAETTFSNGTVTIPANTLKVGDIVRITAQGIATSTNGTDTLTVKADLAGTDIATTGAVDVANNDIFQINLTLVVRTIGASGTYVVVGDVSLGASGTVTQKSVFLASTTFDTTAALTLTITATWSVASASNSVRMDVLLVEHVKASTSGETGVVQEVLGQAVEAVDNSLGAAEEFLAVQML